MKNNLKKKITIMLSILAISSSLTTTVSAIQLGGGITGSLNGITCHGYVYRHVPSNNYISSEATSDSTAAQLKTRVYYIEYSTPNPSSIPCGSVASKTNAKSSGYSQISGTINPTHVKGWCKVSDGNSAYWESTKDYEFNNHEITISCKLDSFDPESVND